MENPIKMDDLGVPLFSETPICFIMLYSDHVKAGWLVNWNKGWTLKNKPFGAIMQLISISNTNLSVGEEG